MASSRIKNKTMNKIFILSLFSISFIFLIPSVQAEITYQPRYWEESCSHELNETVIECQDKKFLSKYIDVTFTEKNADNWYLCLEIHPVLWNRLKECYLSPTPRQCLKQIYLDYKDKVDVDLTETEWLDYLQNLKQYPIKKLTSRISIDKDSIDFTNKKVCLNINFPDGWRVNEKIKIGFATITYASSTNLITVIGDATCGDAYGNECNIQDVYEADKGGILELEPNQTGTTGITLNKQVRPADNVSIPIVLNISGFSSSGTCNITGITYNDSTINENITISGNGLHNTTFYWKSISNIDCSNTFGVQVYQNQWGVIWSQGEKNTSFLVDKTTIVIGDGSIETWYADEDVQIVQIYATGFPPPGGATLFKVENDGGQNITHFRLGRLENAELKLGSHGVDIISERGSAVLVDSYAYSTEFYDTSFRSLAKTSIKLYGADGYPYFSRFYGCELENVQILPNEYHSFDIYRTNIHNINDYAFYWMTTESPTIDDLMAYANKEIFFAGGSLTEFDVTVNNLIAKNNTYLFHAYYFFYGFNGNFYIIDADVDDWNFLWDAGTHGGKIWRQYSFDLTVTDEDGNPINNADIDINSTSTDTNCFNNHTTTDANGGIDTQTITMGYYNETGGDTIYSCNPYVFKIEKSGYETLNFTANIIEKTGWTLSLKEGKTQLTLIKNIQYSNENSTHVNYTITDQVINTGTINITDIVFQDSDISAPFVIDNLGVNKTNTTSGIVTIAKAMNNQEKTFVAATATVVPTVYSSNQPSVLIPGTGGPADVEVSVPSSVTVGGTIEGNITITNMNPDIGQDFTVDYMITSLDETINYSSGQKTVYVGASSTNSTLGPLTAPSQAGMYKYKTIVYWIGDSANASATFTVVEAVVTTTPGGPSGAPFLVGKGEIKISEYPSDVMIEQGSVEFYSIAVENNGTGSIHNVELTLFGIPRQWYSLIPEKIDEISRGKSQVFILKITTPLDAEPKVYSVDIKASCDEDTDEVSISLEVLPRIVEEPFRIIDIQVLTQKLFLNEKGKLIILLENIGNEDLNVVASLSLPEGWSIDKKEVTKVIPLKNESTIEFNVTPIEAGAHTLFLNGTYNDKEFSKEILVYVESMGIVTIPSIPWQWFIIPIVLVVLIVTYRIIKKKIHKPEPEKFKEITPEAKIEEIYTCANCGRGIGVHDARLYNGEVYCIKCLVDAGIIK